MSEGKDGVMVSSTDDQDQRLRSITSRMKANGFFFAGSLLYLPPSIWDVAVTSADGSVDRTEAQERLYILLLLGATVSYFFNGLLEVVWVA